MAAQPHRRIFYGSHPDQHVEMWEPSDGGPNYKGSAVLIHGGYWRHRYTLELMHPMAEHLCRRGWQVYNIEYRRVEGNRGVWTETSADVLVAVALAEPEPVVVIGHSAGGHLALWAAAVADNVDAVIALAPVADLAEADRRSLSDGAVRELLGGDRYELPQLYAQASPANVVPLGVPQLLVHGHADDAVPLDISIAYVERARAAADNVTIHSPVDVDHFHLIDPTHEVWATIDDQLESWAHYRGRSE